MAMNDMAISQAATLLNRVVSQMTGQTALTAITTPADIVSVAQTALKTGYDPVINALSQVWSRTIFAARDYKSSYNMLEMDLDRYGNAIRKLSPVSANMVDDDSYKWPVTYDATEDENPTGNGASVDPWTIYKQDVLQTNFYGTAVYEQAYTIFKDQFDTAFHNAEEFMRFNTMNMTERNNDKESFKEGVARTLQLNFIGGLLAENDTNRVIHVLTEYNAATGGSYTATTIMAPENYAGFVRWLYARINTLARLFAERSEMFQTVVNSKHILRHTSADNLRVALLSNTYEQIKSMALSNTYHNDLLSLPAFDSVPYWQSIESPDAINVTPVYTSTTGAVTTGTAQSETGIIGVMHDRDAIGFCQTNPWSAITPLNPKGGYWTEYYHARYKTISDNTEKAVVFVLD